MSGIRGLVAALLACGGQVVGVHFLAREWWRVLECLLGGTGRPLRWPRWSPHHPGLQAAAPPGQEWTLIHTSTTNTTCILLLWTTDYIPIFLLLDLPAPSSASSGCEFFLALYIKRALSRKPTQL